MKDYHNTHQKDYHNTHLKDYLDQKMQLIQLMNYKYNKFQKILEEAKDSLD